MKSNGKLYLIPTPLGEHGLHTIPVYAIELLHTLDFFIAEKARTARRFIKSTAPSRPISVLNIYELNKYTDSSEKATFLDPALEGHSIGLLSEAGCPGVADPGAEIVARAHRMEIEVVPLVGPSSILLALMASGMNGQQFCFHGYLTQKKEHLPKALRQLEQQALKTGHTQIFIETPYRNQSLFEQALKHLSPSTRFCVAADLTLATQYIRSGSISHWRKNQHPDLHKRPAIFLISG